ncbi:fluoride efflux transporter FluC [Streptomyces sp. NPDC050504]|uniref:fluoride efflux transporter FluC n=1 Tax=Streptomyces sp. NPDC050504 TaxID=3365618 RepID=UPI0037BB6184
MSGARPEGSGARAVLGGVPPGTLGIIAVGGALGSVTRYGAALAWPSVWGVLVVNVVGCALIGVLMVLVAERGAGPAWVRPLLGVGVLGGFTTFSTYALDAVRLLERGEAVRAVLYVTGTLGAAMAAVWAAATVTRRAVGRWPGARRTGGRRTAGA